MPPPASARTIVQPLVDLARTAYWTLEDFDPYRFLPERRRPEGAPRVGLVGYYGWGNYGDELFLEVFREHLEPAVRLQPVLDPRRRRQGGRRIGSAVRASDTILIGGGDLIRPARSHDPYWHSSYLRRPVAVAGIGVTTWDQPTTMAVSRLRRFLGHPSVRFLATRDDESSDWVRQTLEPAVPVLTAPDLVCGLSLPAVERPADPPILGIVVRRRSVADDLGQVRRLAIRASELGYRIRRIVLATGETRTRDLEATAELGLDDAELVASDDLAALSRAIGQCSVLATMKFHGVVVATMYGIPAIALMSTAKNRNFLRRVGRPDLVAKWNAPDLVERLEANPAPIGEDVVGELRESAVAHLGELRRAILAGL